MSHDDGANWSRRGGNLPFGDFTSILINPRNGDEIFVGNAYQTGEIGGGVYRTVNAGKTWARIDLKEHRLAKPENLVAGIRFAGSEHALRGFAFRGSLCSAASAVKLFRLTVGDLVADQHCQM